MAVGDTELVGLDIHTEQVPDGDTQDGVLVGAQDIGVQVPDGVQDMDLDGEVMETVYMEDYMEQDGVDYMVDMEDGDGHTEVV